MHPIDFKEANIVFGKDQPEYLPLPAHKTENDHGEIVTAWKLSFIERIIVLFTGIVWVNCLTFNQPLQPLKLSDIKPEMNKE